MKHQNSKRKLNVSSKHRKALLRNQAIHLILHGKLKTTSARIKEVRKLIEKAVTKARRGNTYANRRLVLKMLPYSKQALDKLFTDIAPKYQDRPGGYTRIRLLQHRLSDTASISQLTWV